MRVEEARGEMVADVFVGVRSAHTVTGAPGAPATAAEVPPQVGPAGGAVEPVDLFEGTDDELTEQSWQERALCAQTEPEAYFPAMGGSTREAKRFIRGCYGRCECLE